MSAILESERKTFKASAFLAAVYAVLSIGAVTMVWPFAVMLSSSLSSSYDYHRHTPAVIGFFDSSDRFARYVSTLFPTFPREVYPDAPASWTTWQSVAADRGGVKAFAMRELEGLDDKKIFEEKKSRAAKFIRALAETPTRRLSCNHDPRDVANFLKRKYGTTDALRKDWRMEYRSFFDVSFSAESKALPDAPQRNDAKFRAWEELKREYVERAIARGDFVSRTMPCPIARHAAEIRNAIAVQFAVHGWRDFLADAFRNYATVFDYLFVRGRSFVNTIILVVLSVLASLTVNPLAAYALSRFALPCTEKILLFMLATMAFPAAVTAIPGFLLIRDLGLLNTFAALVLPTVASAMGIFILKGFFDALPRELYEAATIDGASEWTVFRKIPLPMTAPILAVNALNAFIHAYSSWEWAFLVCQKESHWTLAVWMYQMSQTMSHSPWCVMAGFVAVSIPTAIVFLACQKAILRGIVLPSMK